MARAKRASDDVYNARRRLRRAAERAERMGDASTAERLRAMARETYVGRGARASIERAAQAAAGALSRAAKFVGASFGDTLRRLRNIIRPGESRRSSAVVRRDNEIFARQLNMASSDLPSSIDRRDLSGRSQARIFWMSTRKIWMGLPADQRYEAIMRAAGTDSLREAFERVMRYNAEAVSMAEGIEAELRDTLTQMGDERGDEPVNVSSPPEFMYFVNDYSNIVNLMS